MIAEWLMGILTGGTMVALATNSFEAGAAGVLGPGFTPGMLMLLGLGLAGLGMWGLKKICPGTPVDGRSPALGGSKVNFRETSLFYEQEERGANRNEDILNGKWNEIKGGVKEKWGKLTDDDLTQVEGVKEKLLGLLQKRYGYAQEKAEQEYKEFIGCFK